MKYILLSAALVAAQLAAPAAANAGQTRRDVPVRIADLDLGTREGVAALDRRLARAVVKACGSAHYLEPEQVRDLDRCRAAARERAMATRDRILHLAAGQSALGARAGK